VSVIILYHTAKVSDYFIRFSVLKSKNQRSDVDINFNHICIRRELFMLKIGVLGTGYLGKIHMQVLSELPELFQSIHFFDPDIKAAKEASARFGIEPCHSLEALINEVDVVDIVSSTPSHFQCASNAIRNLKHVFIEKPVTSTLEESNRLIKLAKEAQVIAQVGHIERFNPAFLAISSLLENTKYIEAHRLSQYKGRNNDVSVILDVMIHDIDLILAVTKANVRRVSANGASVLTPHIDIANARIELDNGCVANLTASRVATDSMRKMRFYQKDACYVSDFLNKTAHGYELLRENEENEITKKNLAVPDSNALKHELSSFGQAVLHQTEPTVSLEDGHKALAVAEMIAEKIRLNVFTSED
jgi:predicted dehydrogenase